MPTCHEHFSLSLGPLLKREQPYPSQPLPAERELECRLWVRGASLSVPVGFKLKFRLYPPPGASFVPLTRNPPDLTATGRLLLLFEGFHLQLTLLDHL